MTIVFLTISVMFLCMFFHLPTVPDEEQEHLKKDLKDDEPDHLSPVRSPIVASTGNQIVVEIHEGT